MNSSLFETMRAAISLCAATLDADIDRLIAKGDLLTAARLCLTIYANCDPEIQCSLIRGRAARRYKALTRRQA
jgi:hypothetical protein